MAEDTSRIVNWLKSREVEEKISSKSQTRVLRTMAEGIKNTKPLPIGNCGVCGNHVEQLIPYDMNVCSKCHEKFIKNGGGCKLVSKEYCIHYCDNCLGRSLSRIKVNVLMCGKCLKKLGRRHNHGVFEQRKERNRFMQTVPWRQPKS